MSFIAMPRSAFVMTDTRLHMCTASLLAQSGGCWQVKSDAGAGMCPKLAQICGDLLGSDTCVLRISGDYVKQCHAGTLSELYREVFGNYRCSGSIRIGVPKTFQRRFQTV